MLGASLGAVALSLSGCKNTRTTILFVNGSAAPVTISATGDGQSFNVKNLQPGHSTPKRVILSSDKLGTISTVSGTVTVAGVATPFTTTISEGYTNTITVSPVFTVTNTPS